MSMKQIQRLRPGPPTLLTIGTVLTTSIALSWTAASFAGGSAITGYNVYYRITGSGSLWTLFGNTAGTSSTVTGLTTGTNYDFIVNAVNSYGESVPCNIATQKTN